MNSTRLKEIMSAQSKAGVGRLELNFETAFEVIEALEQAEQAVQRVREVAFEYRPSIPEEVLHEVMKDILEALGGDGRG